MITRFVAGSTPVTRTTGIRPFCRSLLFSNGRLFLPRSPEFSENIKRSAETRAFARFTARYFSVTGGFFCPAVLSFQKI